VDSIMWNASDAMGDERLPRWVDGIQESGGPSPNYIKVGTMLHT
jgi:hypothetical protein